jgi:hypothetical protein
MIILKNCGDKNNTIGNIENVNNSYFEEISEVEPNKW